MLAREEFLTEEPEHYYCRDDIGEYLIVPISLNMLALIVLIVGLSIYGTGSVEDKKEAVVLLHFRGDYFFVYTTIALTALGTCYKYILSSNFN